MVLLIRYYPSQKRDYCGLPTSYRDTRYDNYTMETYFLVTDHMLIMVLAKAYYIVKFTALAGMDKEIETFSVSIVIYFSKDFLPLSN